MPDSVKNDLEGLLDAPPHPDPVGAVQARYRRRRGQSAATRVAVAAAVVAVAAGPALLTDRGEPTRSTVGTTPTASSRTSGGCEYRPAPAQQPAVIVSPPPANPQVPAASTVEMQFSDGTVRAELFGALAPCAVASFRHLTSQGFYDGHPCHRLTAAAFFVLQCGDPTGTGLGVPGYEFDEENLADADYPAGTLALANAGPGRSGSQFFLVYKDSPQLPPDYTPFGRVTDGLDVLLRAAARGQDGSNGGVDGRPLPPGVEVESVRVSA